MRNLNEDGFRAFFQGATVIELAAASVLGVLLFVYATASLVIVLASIDALKDYLLDSGPAKPD